MIAGGNNPSGFVSTAELYDPSSGTFSLTGSLNTQRVANSATLLPNGEVLIGGRHIHQLPGQRRALQPRDRDFHAYGEYEDDNGQVLIAGGAPHLASTVLYNPSSGTFGTTGSLNTGRTDYTAVLLTNGEVLAAGGYDGSGGNIGYLSSAELFH